jgi:hypothetical protein
MEEIIQVGTVFDRRFSKFAVSYLECIADPSKLRRPLLKGFA